MVTVFPIILSFAVFLFIGRRTSANFSDPDLKTSIAMLKNYIQFLTDKMTGIDNETKNGTIVAVI